MLQTLLVSLIVAFLTALAYIAYRHPAAFPRIGYILMGATMVAYVIIGAYNAGLADAKKAISDQLVFEMREAAVQAIDSRKIPIEVVGLVTLAFFVYLGILLFLPHLLGNHQKNKPE
jgi:MFS superfamily sulfate permease-like transporter